jgi:hypothetical protein
MLQGLDTHDPHNEREKKNSFSRRGKGGAACKASGKMKSAAKKKKVLREEKKTHFVYVFGLCQYLR